MEGLRKSRQLLVLPLLTLAGTIVSVSGLVYFAGQSLAYLSLVFGILFFVFAARYYLAIITVLVAPSEGRTNGKKAPEPTNNDDVENYPMVSVHLALYNEERVVDRLLTACSKLDYPNFEVVVVDDSNDGTVGILNDWMLKDQASGKPKLKVIHRENRKGFKGGALNEALRNTDARAEFVTIFDADFVPQPNILKNFLAYFNRHGKEGNGNGGGERYSNGKLAAVQGYQWHTLNRTENWLTRGVSCEFSGNYMVDRTFQEVNGMLKMVAGSVYMIRADILREFKWSGSITEDWELTLRLYEKGFKVLYTPLVQAPGECPSNLGKLVRQRMRWAEGHTYNVKKHFIPILLSRKLGIREKLEFLYFAPYYLQSAFLILGTLFWFTSDVALGAKLPFWTATVGWGLVFSNLLALPLMSLTGLFLEKRARKDFPGLFSQLLLIYALSPYQGYAALKGLIEPVEGSWVRTFKSGVVAGFPGKLEPRRVIKKVLPPKPAGPTKGTALITFAVLGLTALMVTAAVQGQFGSAQTAQPAYYFYNQRAPSGYAPFPNTPDGDTFLMHLAVPTGNDSVIPIGPLEETSVIFFSDPAPNNLALPFGSSVSMHVWVNDSQTILSNGTIGDLKFRIDIYNPTNNSVRHIEGAGETEVFSLQPGLNLYQASWGHIANNKTIDKGETLMATIWCSDCKVPPTLVFNSPQHASNIDFPIEVPEDYLPMTTAALFIPLIAGLFVGPRKEGGKLEVSGAGDGGGRNVQRLLIVAGAVIFLTLPLVITFNDALSTIFNQTGLDRLVSPIVPYEAAFASDLIRGFGLPGGSSASSVWLSGGFIPVTANIDWNCAGWQGFLLFGLTCLAGLGEVRTSRGKVLVLAAGVLGIFILNVLRITIVVLMGYYLGYPSALIFHDYGGAIMTLAWLFVFWAYISSTFGRNHEQASFA